MVATKEGPATRNLSGNRGEVQKKYCNRPGLLSDDLDHAPLQRGSQSVSCPPRQCGRGCRPTAVSTAACASRRVELSSGTGETEGGTSSESSVHAIATAEQPLSAKLRIIASTSSRASAEYLPTTSSS